MLVYTCFQRGSNTNQRDQVVPTFLPTSQSSSKSSISSAITASLSSSLLLASPSSSPSSSPANRAPKRARSLSLTPQRNTIQGSSNNTISVEHVGSDARQLTASDIGQFQFLIQSRTSSRNVPNSSTPLSRSNTVAQHQSNGLSLHGRLLSSNIGLQRSRTVVLRSNSGRSQMTQTNVNNNNSISPNRINGGMNNISNYSRFLSRLYRNAIALGSNHPGQQRSQYVSLNNIQSVGQQRRGSRPSRHSTGSVNIPNTGHSRASSQLSPNRTTTFPLSTSPIDLHRTQRAQIMLSESVKILFDTFNEMFIRGQIPNQNAENLQSFNGVITEDLADKICVWLTRSPEYRFHSIIHRIFISPREVSSVNRVVEFLRRCGIAMETMNGTTKIRREQTLDLIMIMTYLLQAAGYNNSYFIAN